MKQYRAAGRGLTSPKPFYAPGEEVTMVYDRRYIASDTNYRFSSGDVEFAWTFEQEKGYVIRFIMPEHDVEIEVTKENTMTFDPNALRNAMFAMDMRKKAGAGGAGEPDPTAGRFWTCPECKSVNDGKFCPECGLKRP